MKELSLNELQNVAGAGGFGIYFANGGVHVYWH